MGRGESNRNNRLSDWPPRFIRIACVGGISSAKTAAKQIAILFNGLLVGRLFGWSLRYSPHGPTELSVNLPGVESISINPVPDPGMVLPWTVLVGTGNRGGWMNGWLVG